MPDSGQSVATEPGLAEGETVDAALRRAAAPETGTPSAPLPNPGPSFILANDFYSVIPRGVATGLCGPNGGRRG